MVASHLRRLTVVGFVAAAVLMGVSGTLSAERSPFASASLVLGNLNGPRGLTVGPAGRIVFTEITGVFSEMVARGHNSGAVSALGSVPATYIAPAISTDGRGQIYVLVAGNPPGAPPAPGVGTLYRATPGEPSLRMVADIIGYQETDPDPYNVDGPPEESNPFGVATLPDGSVLVSDAAGNDLLRVYPNGQIVTVARLKPRMVAVPGELPGPPDFPPAGTVLPSEGVATSVTVGADGYYYVGELRGFPATPGTSQIWRIEPDSVDAVCDPAAPDVGPCQRYADGFTSIVDLEAAPDGSLYVVELVQQSWLQWELGAPPIGGVFCIPPGGGAPVELAPGELILPAGIGLGRDGSVFVSGPVFGPGAVVKVN